MEMYPTSQHLSNKCPWCFYQDYSIYQSNYSISLLLTKHFQTQTVFVCLCCVLLSVSSFFCISPVTELQERHHGARSAPLRAHARHHQASRERKARERRNIGGNPNAMMATAAEEICSSRAISENTETSVSFKSARKNQDRTWKLRFIYLQCCEYQESERDAFVFKALHAGFMQV